MNINYNIIICEQVEIFDGHHQLIYTNLTKKKTFFYSSFKSQT